MEQGFKHNIAVLIDADNVGAQYIDDVLNTISTYGHISLKRAYGNWTKECLDSWLDVMTKKAIRPVQQQDFVKHKNATDMALTIDAMDLLHTGIYDSFALVSSDSDFTPLVLRLREAGLFLIGAGDEKAPASLVQAFDVFNIIGKGKNKKVQPSQFGVEAVHKALKEFASSNARDDGFTLFSAAGTYLLSIDPSFKFPTIGFQNMKDFMEHYPDIYEISTLPTASNIYTYRVIE